MSLSTLQQNFARKAAPVVVGLGVGLGTLLGSADPAAAAIDNATCIAAHGTPVGTDDCIFAEGSGASVIGGGATTATANGGNPTATGGAATAVGGKGGKATVGDVTTGPSTSTSSARSGSSRSTSAGGAGGAGGQGVGKVATTTGATTTSVQGDKVEGSLGLSIQPVQMPATSANPGNTVCPDATTESWSAYIFGYSTGKSNVNMDCVKELGRQAAEQQNTTEFYKLINVMLGSGNKAMAGQALASFSRANHFAKEGGQIVVTNITKCPGLMDNPAAEVFMAVEDAPCPPAAPLAPISTTFNHVEPAPVRLPPVAATRPHATRPAPKPAPKPAAIDCPPGAPVTRQP